MNGEIISQQPQNLSLLKITSCDYLFFFVFFIFIVCSAYRILTRKFSAVFCFVRTHKHNTHLPGTETCGGCNEAAESECVPSMMRIPKTFREHFNL